jgi:hypothetical protein
MANVYYVTAQTRQQLGALAGVLRGSRGSHFEVRNSGVLHSAGFGNGCTGRAIAVFGRAIRVEFTSILVWFFTSKVFQAISKANFTQRRGGRREQGQNGKARVEH